MSTETNEYPEDDDIGQDGHPVALLGRYALGTLDPDEVEQVTRHVQHCRTCRAELAAYDEVVSLLPYAAPLQQVPIRARARLLARLDEIGSANQQRMMVLPAMPREPRRPLPWLRLSMSPRAVAFAAVPLAIVFAIVGIMADVINDQQEQIATIEDAKKEVESIVLGEPDDEPSEADFISSTSAAQARGKLIVNHETNTALILAKDLPALDDGQRYIAWLRLPAPEEYGRVGILEVDDDGRASLSVEPRDAIERYTEVIVTLEANGDVSSPTGPRVMTAAVAPDR